MFAGLSISGKAFLLRYCKNMLAPDSGLTVFDTVDCKPRIVSPSAILLASLLAFGVVGLDAKTAVIEFPNGDRLTGEVVSVSGDVITFRPQWGGELELDRKGLNLIEQEDAAPPTDAGTAPEPGKADGKASVEPKPEPDTKADKPENPAATNTKGKPADAQKAKAAQTKPEPAQPPVDKESIKVAAKKEPPPKPAPKAAAKKSPSAKPTETAESSADLPDPEAVQAWWESLWTWWKEDRPFQKWNTRIDFSVSEQAGERDRSDVDIRVQTVRKFESSELRLKWDYDFGTQTRNGETSKSTDRYTLESRYRHDLNKQQNFFVESNTRYHSDQIKEIDMELEQSVGLGFRFLKTKKMDGSITPLITAERLDRNDIEGDWQPEASIRQDFNWRISKIFSAKQDFRYQVDLNETDLYEIEANFRLSAKVTKSVDVNLRYEYDQNQDVREGIDPVSTKTVVGLGVRF